MRLQVLLMYHSSVAVVVVIVVGVAVCLALADMYEAASAYLGLPVCVLHGQMMQLQGSAVHQAAHI